MANNLYEIFQKIISNSITHLHAITNNNLVPPVLKSYYTMKRQLLQSKHYISIADNLKQKKKSCPRCCIKYSEGPVSHYIQPEQKPSHFRKYIANKVDKSKVLTRCQQKYLLNNKLRPGNSLVTTCGFCKREVSIPMTKPPKLQLDEPISNLSTSSTKKRKKEKDKKKNNNFSINNNNNNSTTKINGVLNKSISKSKKKRNRKSILSKNLNNVNLIETIDLTNSVEKKKTPKKNKNNPKMRQQLEKIFNKNINKPKNRLNNFLQSLQ